MRLKIASRKSDLARLQAYTVADALKKTGKNLNIEHVFSASFGDNNPDISLNEMPDKGVFTNDFVLGLKNRDFDVVVHSWKDLPTDLPETSKIFTLKREDPRDVLLVKKSSLEEIKKNKKISVLTSSPRRVHHITPFLENYYPAPLESITCSEVRGNIPTRLKKLKESQADHALLMAKAALDRLLSTSREDFKELKAQLNQLRDEFTFMVLPLSLYPTAAAQGALAIEVLKERSDLCHLFEKITCHETFDHVQKERNLLSSFGGGCHQKIGMTSLPHRNGYFFSASGVQTSGHIIKEVNFDDNKESQKFKQDESYPGKKIEGTLFNREFLRPKISHNQDLYISKDLALPEDYIPHQDQLIATAGLVTWKRLAQKGVWVHCSSDSLGSPYGTNIESLAGRKTNWLSLTHEDSPIDPNMNQLATYKLIENEQAKTIDMSQ